MTSTQNLNALSDEQLDSVTGGCGYGRDHEHARHGHWGFPFGLAALSGLDRDHGEIDIQFNINIIKDNTITANGPVDITVTQSNSSS
jgi:hypothetical protein